jgi:membrane protein required for colicin V production
LIADIAIAVVLVASGALAYFRGLVKEVLTVAGWIGAALATWYGFPLLRPVFGSFIESNKVVDIVSAAVIFVITLVALTILSHILSARIKGSTLGHLNRALGFVFGVLRGVVLVALIYIGATVFWDEDDFPDQIADAKSLPLVKGTSEFLAAFLPAGALPGDDVQKNVEGIVEGAEEQMEKIIDEVEIEEKLQQLNQPQPTPPADNGDKSEAEQQGYDDAERREMQRLIESNQ